MKKLSRRSLLLWGGAGAAAATAGVAVPAITLLARGKSNTYAFRAVAGLPTDGKLPSYCSMVYEGHIDLTAKNGVVTRTMHAGYPQGSKGTDVSPLVWPGFSQKIRVTDVQSAGNTLTVKGVIDDRSQVRAGESVNVTLTLDRSACKGSVPFSGSSFPAATSN
jgi:hypothetical protein